MLFRSNFHMFYQKVDAFPSIKLSDEHTDYRFVTLEEARRMPLIRGGLKSLEYIQEVKRIFD